MVALIEDVPGRKVLLFGTERRLDHHQGVVGDYDLRPTGAAHAALYEAAAVVRAGGIDAFAATVRESDAAAGAEQVGQPAREIAARHVAIARRHRPSRHQAEGDGVLRTLSQLAGKLGQIEEAEIVLA